jgi:uncharacterized protein YuzE
VIKTKKYIAFILVLLLSGSVLLGCSSVPAMTDKDFSIKVTGDSGAKFSGAYDITTTEGKSENKSVDGTVPVEYNVKGNIVSVSFQKKAETGNLKVEILQDGKVVAQSETSAAYGVVSVATPSK